MCVDKDAWPSGYIDINAGESNLKNGEIYVVEDVFLCDGYLWFEVNDGTSDYKEYGYWENCFARCSSIDEPEFKRDYELQK